MDGKRQMATRHPASNGTGIGSTARWQQRAKAAGAKTSAVLPALVVFGAVALSGCGNIEPWVKPYERQQIADPIMAFDANPVSSAYKDHVFEAREGSRGATGSAGGGCGCN